MNKISTVSLLLSTVIYFGSCVDEQELVLDNNEIRTEKIDLTQEELNSIAYDNLSEISEEEVFSMVANFVNQRNEKAKTRSASIPKMTVRKKSYLGRQAGAVVTKSSCLMDSIPIYDVVVNNEDKTSYAVVSADKREPGVLVFFDNFPIDEKKIQEGLNHPNTKAIMSLSKGELIQNVETIEEAKRNLRERTVAKICKKFNIPVSEYSFENLVDKICVDGGKVVTRNHQGTQDPIGNFVAEKKPMCQIVWEQKPPYNGECPMGKILISLGEYSFVADANVPAGCVTIACIHAHACVETPNIGGIPMRWSYYKSTKVLNEHETSATEFERARKAIRHIYDELKCSPIYAYHEGEQYVHSTGSTLGEDYIMKNFNYQKKQTFDPDVVLASLNANKPIYVSGEVYGNQEENPDSYGWEGHAFVIDGYIIQTKTPLVYSIQQVAQTKSDIVQYYDMYWHINLGWGDNSNAYFKLDSDATCTPQFFDKYGRYNLVPLKNMTIITHLSVK